MQSDGIRSRYDVKQLQAMCMLCQLPLGATENFIEVFLKSYVNGSLAASAFHDKILTINEMKLALKEKK